MGLLALLSYQEYNTFAGRKIIILAILNMILVHKRFLKGKTMQFTQDELDALLKKPKPLNLAGL